MTRDSQIKVWVHPSITSGPALPSAFIQTLVRAVRGDDADVVEGSGVDISWQFLASPGTSFVIAAPGAHVLPSGEWQHAQVWRYAQPEQVDGPIGPYHRTVFRRLETGRCEIELELTPCGFAVLRARGKQQPKSVQRQLIPDHQRWEKRWGAEVPMFPFHVDAAHEHNLEFWECVVYGRGSTSTEAPPRVEDMVRRAGRFGFPADQVRACLALRHRTSAVA